MAGGSRETVLRAIALDGPLSRSQIAEELGISSATVTAVTRDLLDVGLVEMAGKAPANGTRGRPQELLTIVPRAATVLGVKVAEEQIAAVATDLRGDVVEEFELAFDPTGPDPSGRLAELLRAITAGVGGRLIGIGLGVPGTVASVDEGTVGGAVTSPMFGWHDLPLAELLAERLGVPVIVDNDVNTLTIAEHLYGNARDVDDFVVITWGRGIGAGIFLDGALRRGRGGAGELGHTVAVPGGPRCECGRRGCLEAVAAVPALVDAARRERLVGVDDGLESLLAVAASSDRAAALLMDAGGSLGRAVADVVNLLAPQMVVLSGEGMVAWEHLRPGFDAALADGVLGVHAEVPVTVEPWQDGSWARGAAALVLGTLLSPSTGVTPADRLRTRLHAVEEVGA